MVFINLVWYPTFYNPYREYQLGTKNDNTPLHVTVNKDFHCKPSETLYNNAAQPTLIDNHGMHTLPYKSLPYPSKPLHTLSNPIHFLSYQNFILNTLKIYFHLFPPYQINFHLALIFTFYLFAHLYFYIYAYTFYLPYVFISFNLMCLKLFYF